MTSTTALARACHVKPTLAVTVYTSALALGAGRRWGAVPVGAAALAGQLAVGWSNDYIDRDRDRSAGRADKPIAAGEVAPERVRNAATVAAVACVPLSLLSGWRAASIHGAAVGAAFAYNLRLKGTAASALPYAFAFGALPAFVTLGGPQRRWPAPSTVLAAAALGAGAHFINALPDLESDERTGVRGLPHRLGATRSLAVGVALLGGATAAVARAGGGPVRRATRVLASTAGVSIAGVAAAAAAERRRLAWTLALATSAVTVGVSLTRSNAL